MNNGLLEILQGDCLQVLRTLPDESVHCCVTSPPYWGLRDYGTGAWEGGSSECDHKSGRFERGGLSSKQASNNGSGGDEARKECPKCGARRIDRQIGLENTPEEYVAKMVEVFREVRRVLRLDGTLWLNLGDSYAQNGSDRNGGSDGRLSTLGSGKATLQNSNRCVGNHGLKPKDLCGIPWRVAFALQTDGWWLRSDIIWHKPNPMPESVTDRPTKAHEYLFLIAKSERYYYDAEAIKEPQSQTTFDRFKNGCTRKPSKKHIGTEGECLAGHDTATAILENGRNKRSVWTVPSSAYPESHFATFPPDLIKPCILAGCPVGGTVLDPFGGSGTTGQVALELGRRAVLIELNPEYVKLAEDRCNVTPGLAF